MGPRIHYGANVPTLDQASDTLGPRISTWTVLMIQEWEFFPKQFPL